MEKMNRSLETTVTELRRKFEAAQKEVMELVVVKNQLLKDNSELNNQISSNLNQACSFTFIMIDMIVMLSRG